MTDVDRATITLPLGDFAQLSKRLADQGMFTQLVGVHGRYHTHLEDRETVLKQVRLLCEQDKRFYLPSAKHLNLPLRSNIDGNLIKHGMLHDIALESALTKTCNWYETVKAALDEEQESPAEIITIGGAGTLPRSLSTAGTVNGQAAFQPVEDFAKSPASVTPSWSDLSNDGVESIASESAIPDNAIAVIGMSCRYSQAESLEAFWSLINSGKNTAQPVPKDRFNTADLWRAPKGPYFGSFIDDHDAFNNRFFNISAREAASMDPQQRLVLQVAYEAMESSGYGAGLPTKRVGCYVGVATDEYEFNVASEDATAFSATGTLRAFISGKVSHYFGWTGPSLVFDTACSSSAVAIHHACKVSQYFPPTRSFLWSHPVTASFRPVLFSSKKREANSRTTLGSSDKGVLCRSCWWCQCHDKSIALPESQSSLVSQPNRCIQGLRRGWQWLLPRRGRRAPGPQATRTGHRRQRHDRGHNSRDGGQPRTQLQPNHRA